MPTNFIQAESSARRKVNSFLVAVIIQNVPGKSSASKKAAMNLEGSLVVNTVFEDAMNCQYYLEKKVSTGVEEFRIPPGITPPSRAV